MKSISPALFSAISLFLTVSPSGAQNFELTELGSTALNVSAGSTTLGYTNTSASLILTNFASPGENELAGFFTSAPLDWSTYVTSPYVGFALNMSVSGVNPNTAFTVDIYGFDGVDYFFINTWDGFTTGVSNTLSLVNLTTSETLGDYSDVYGIGFTFDGSLSPPNSITLDSVYGVVPEPTTYALLVLSGLALGGYAIRRRHRA